MILAVIAIVGIFVLVSLGSVVESLDASHVMVVQSPVSGVLTWHTTPGLKWQGWGSYTKYKKRDQFWFSSTKDQGKGKDESIPIRFNDGGNGSVSGSISYDMPLDSKNLTQLHTRYGSQEAIDQQLIRTTIEKVV